MWGTRDATGARLLRAAGPPKGHVIGAITAGSLIDVVLAVATPTILVWPVYVLPVLVLTSIVALADRDGWLVRQGMAYLWLEQARRTGDNEVPTTPSAARRWLDDPANEGATPFDLASVLITAGRYEEASATLEGAPVRDPVDEVRALRLGMSADAARDPTIEIDLEAVRDASTGLPPDERRYHLMSAAWTRAWLDIHRRRPWRAQFAAVVRQNGPFPLPRAVRLMIANHQLAAPALTTLVGMLGGAVLALIGLSF